LKLEHSVQGPSDRAVFASRDCTHLPYNRAVSGGNNLHGRGTPCAGMSGPMAGTGWARYGGLQLLSRRIKGLSGQNEFPDAGRNQ
jgi:hypothetical protein